MASAGTTIGSLDATTKAALSEEQIALRQAVRSFMDTRIEPIIAECEKEGRLPVEVLTDLAQSWVPRWHS